MLSRRLKVRTHHGDMTGVEYDRDKANKIAVIARNALAQEESQDFNPDFPETIPINMNESNEGCSC
jgi:hypothetical protein